MIIYKVRLLNQFGVEVAEFGFFEDKDDAITRRLEVLNKISMPGELEIREIEVQESSKNKGTPKTPETDNVSSAVYKLKD